MINELSALQAEGMVVKRGETIHHSDRFRSREFVIEINSSIDGETVIDYLRMKVVQERCELIDELRNGYRVTVTFKLSGRKYKRKDTGETDYFTNIEALNIEVLDDANNFEGDAGPSVPKPQEKMPDPLEPEDFDDLPF